MNLILDLGNSRLKWALADNRLQPGGAITYDERFAEALDETFGGLARPARALAVSVAAAERTDMLARWLRSHWGIALERVTAQAEQLGVTNSYHEPMRLGADRWAALIAAHARFGSTAVCVVDCGTAVTMDALDSKGVFRGGVILPGRAMQCAALPARTQGVRETGGEPRTCLARSTADAVAAGVLFGLAGAIDRILDEQSKALGTTPRVLITGGDAQQLLPHLRHAATYAPDLVLEGVARIAAPGRAP